MLAKLRAWHAAGGAHAVVALAIGSRDEPPFFFPSLTCRPLLTTAAFRRSALAREAPAVSAIHNRRWSSAHPSEGVALKGGIT